MPLTCYLENRRDAACTSAFQPCAPLKTSHPAHGKPVCRQQRRRVCAPVTPHRSARSRVLRRDEHPSARVRWTASAGSPAGPDWGQLSVETFDAVLKGRSLPLCLVGMSNCGKSFWSRRLRDDLHFGMQSVDDDIEQALKPELEAGGFYGINGLAAWMGFPSDARFQSAQEKYLAAEETVTAGACGDGRAAAAAATATGGGSEGGNFVLDTTGSVVYLRQETLERLREKFFVVHLRAEDEMLEGMTKRFFETPKPVVWGDAFDLIEGETADQAIRRCYPRLLRERRVRYEQLAHVSVKASDSLSRELDVSGFLELVRTAIKEQ